LPITVPGPKKGESKPVVMYVCIIERFTFFVSMLTTVLMKVKRKSDRNQASKLFSPICIRVSMNFIFMPCRDRFTETCGLYICVRCKDEIAAI